MPIEFSKDFLDLMGWDNSGDTPKENQPEVIAAQPPVSGGEVDPGGKYGFRYNSTDKKQAGFYGEIPVGNGSVATEFSVGQDINGKGVEMPSIVPGLTFDELEEIKQATVTNKQMSPSIYEKALLHAKERLSQGKSTFWEPGEDTYTLPTKETLGTLIKKEGKRTLP